MNKRLTPDEQRAVVARIAKLLRLSRGTDHAAEAASALAKAAAVAAEAGLSIDGIDADNPAPRITHEAGGVRRRSHSRMQCHVMLRRHFGVDVLGSSYSGAIYVGPAINIALARHIEVYLVRQCAAGWAAFSDTRQRKAHHKRAYEFGFFRGINHVLQEHPICNDHPALSAEIEKYVASNFAVTSAPMDQPEKRHSEMVMNGFLDGRATPCSRPVAGAPTAAMIGGGA